MRGATVGRWAVVLALLVGQVSARAAEHEGALLDGDTFDATAFSYDTGNFYEVQIEFDGDEVTVYFATGGSRRLVLDEEEVEDPHAISAFDYERGTFWELDVEGID